MRQLLHVRVAASPDEFSHQGIARDPFVIHFYEVFEHRHQTDGEGMAHCIPIACPNRRPTLTSGAP